jgi:hypothetical protein
MSKMSRTLPDHYTGLRSDGSAADLRLQASDLRPLTMFFRENLTRPRSDCLRSVFRFSFRILRELVIL